MLILIHLILLYHFNGIVELQILDASPQILEVIQTTKYKVTRASPTQTTYHHLEQSFGSLNFDNVNVNKRKYVRSPKKFANKIFANKHQGSSLEFRPFNPVPMLNPNPFTKRLERHQEEGSFCRRSFDGRSGYCVLSYQCLNVIEEFRKHAIKIDVCTYRGNIPVICCPLADKHVEEKRISAQKCLEYHKELKGVKIDVPRSFSDKQCVASIPMIVGGQLTRSANEYPHMAALGWSQKNREIDWGCGGTLISEQFILTAAHCAVSRPKPPDVVSLGSNNLTSISQTRQQIKILIIILHPKYRSSSYYHDVALAKLTRKVSFSNYIRPACLWQLRELEVPRVTATGWGQTDFRGPKSQTLQKVDLDVIDQRLCKNLYRRERRLTRGINDQQFCAGNLNGGKDTCQGDSGGPLFAELPEFNCVKFVVGVTSFGKFCGAPNAPGVYTNIYSYLDWIEKIVFLS